VSLAYYAASIAAPWVPIAALEGAHVAQQRIRARTVMVSSANLGLSATASVRSGADRWQAAARSVCQEMQDAAGGAPSGHTGQWRLRGCEPLCESTNPGLGSIWCSF
jgi:UrcA family protein